jgi:histidine triad (HIT) family protein
MIRAPLVASLLRSARTRLGGVLLRWLFTYLSFLIPVEKLWNSSTLVAFHHPRPTYPVHILIVPKRNIQGVQELKDTDGKLLREILQASHTLASELKLEKLGYRLVVNGGKYQHVTILHFHLISGSEATP